MKKRRLAVAATILGIGSLATLGSIWAAQMWHVDRDSLERAYFISQIAMPVLVSLSAGLVLWQILDLRRSISVQQFQMTGDRIADMTSSLVANADLYPFFYNSEPLASASDSTQEQRVRLVAEYWLDVMDGELLREEVFASDLPPTPSLREWMIESFRRSPALRTVLQENSAFYRDELIHLASLVDSETAGDDSGDESAEGNPP